MRIKWSALRSGVAAKIAHIQRWRTMKSKKPESLRLKAGLLNKRPIASAKRAATWRSSSSALRPAGMWLIFNPATPLDYLDHTLEKLDMVLLMSVNPGFGGQAFIPGVLPKITEVRRRVQALGRDIRIEVDGGIKVDNIAAVAQAGADTFVAGSAIFNNPDYAATIAAMRKAIAGAGKPGA